MERPKAGAVGAASGKDASARMHNAQTSFGRLRSSGHVLSYACTSPRLPYLLSTGLIAGLIA